MSEAGTLAHRLRRMSGRDPDEHGRASTPLELLFDLTFVVAVGQAANLFAHSVFEGHTWTGLIAFAIAVFAIVWAWINFSWFGSAFDTDDWVFRVVTMVQMVGVCIAALGLPALFHSIDEGGHVDNASSSSGTSSCGWPWSASGCAPRGSRRRAGPAVSPTRSG